MKFIIISLKDVDERQYDRLRLNGVAPGLHVRTKEHTPILVVWNIQSDYLLKEQSRILTDNNAIFQTASNPMAVGLAIEKYMP